MSRSRTKFFLLSFTATFLIGSSADASARHPKNLESSPSDPSSETFLLTPRPDFGSAEFSTKWGRELTEQDKIRYLLDRVASSHERFIRNGRTYNGPKARQWLLFKLGHWVRNVETADDFVKHVASYSQKTGEPYLVKFPEGKTSSLKTILSNELSAFEKNRLDFNQQTQKTISVSASMSVPPVLAAHTSQ